MQSDGLCRADGEWREDCSYNERRASEGLKYYCSNCKQSFKTRSRFCTNCGARMSNATSLMKCIKTGDIEGGFHITEGVSYEILKEYPTFYIIRIDDPFNEIVITSKEVERLGKIID